MDRDEVALVLAVIASGLLVWIAGAVLPAKTSDDEVRAWRSMWMPAMPAILGISILAGWAVVDPEGAHRLGVSRWCLLVPCSLGWARAAYRACRAAFGSGAGPALVKGFLVPRIELSDEFRKVLTEDELRAVLAHEEAHVLHRDPLRMVVSQIVTDLQWPLSKAAARRQTWLHALEIARDDEAILQRGASPPALASALVKAARLCSGPVEGAASLVDHNALLEERVTRLMAEPRPTTSHSRSHSASVAGLLVVLAAFTFGALDGDQLIVWLAGGP